MGGDIYESANSTRLSNDHQYCNEFLNAYIEFDEQRYITVFPDVKKAIQDGVFKSGEEHFIQFGMSEILMKKRFWPKSNGEILVSIICICFNQEKFVTKAIDGFLAQKTNFNFEIIVADDCSNDRTQDIIKSYSDDRLVKILRDKNVGVTNNLLDACSKIQGKYVAFCEGDDWWNDAYKIQKQVDILEGRPDLSICFHAVDVIDEDSGFLYKFPEKCDTETSFIDLIKENYIQTNSVMYRWVFDDKYPMSEMYNTDIMPADWYIHLLHANSGGVYFIDEVMGVYNVNSNGIWGRSNKKERDLKYGLNQLNLFIDIDMLTNGEYSKIISEKMTTLFVSLLNCYIFEEQVEKIHELLHVHEWLSELSLEYIGYEFNSLPKTIKETKELILKNETISVIITTYDQDKYIEQAINSVLQQKGLFDIELIVGDDNSPDKTKDVVLKYKNVKNLKYIKHKKNIGMLRNIEACINECRGRYIAFCEGDDYWLTKDRVKHHLESFRVSPESSMVFNCLLLDDKKNNKISPHTEQFSLSKNKITHEDILLSPITANFSACSYRKKYVDLVPKEYYSYNDAADWLFNLLITKYGSAYFTKNILSVYRIHDKGQWSKKSEVDMQSFIIRTREEYKAFINNNEIVDKCLVEEIKDNRVVCDYLIPDSHGNVEGKIMTFLDGFSTKGDFITVSGWAFKIDSNMISPTGKKLCIVNNKMEVIVSEILNCFSRSDLKVALPTVFNDRESNNDNFGFSCQLKFKSDSEELYCFLETDGQFIKYPLTLTRSLNGWTLK